jgi:hypothetical protein
VALTDSLVSHWKLDEASGNAIDAHGTNDLTETDGTIGSAAGKLGNARDFEAADTEYFNKADNADLSTGDIDFTFAGWVQLESTGAAQAVFSKWPFANEYFLRYDGSRFVWLVGSGSATANNLGAPSSGVWYFFVAWHDSVNNIVGIQINNGTADTTSYSSGVTDAGAEFALGGKVDGGPEYLDGLLDSVSFWKRVLTADEKTELYNGGTGLDYDDWDAGGGGGTTHHIFLPLLGVG